MITAAGDAERNRQEHDGDLLGYSAYIKNYRLPATPRQPESNWMLQLALPPAIGIALIVLLRFAVPRLMQIARTPSRELRGWAAGSFGWTAFAVLFAWIFYDHLLDSRPEKVAALALVPPLIAWCTRWLLRRASA